MDLRSRLTPKQWEMVEQIRLHDTDKKLRDAATDLLSALEDVLPYAIAAIGPPRSLWPSDSVILKAEAAIKKAKYP